MTSTPELTTRDVLQQVDRRLSLIEEDLRSLDDKLDTKFGVLDTKIDTKVETLEAKISVLDAKVDAKIGALDAKIDTKFHLVVGLILASWFSMMGAFLLK